MSQLRKSALPLMELLLYLTLLLPLLLQKEALPEGQTAPVALGLLAFSLALMNVFVALRPKFLEKSTGLPSMYATHGIMAVVLVIAALFHAFNEMGAEKNFTVSGVVMPAGFLALLLLLLATFTGAFVLSGKRNKKKKKKMKRETGLRMHRLSLLAVFLIFVHMMAIDFVRSNTLLSVLSALYTVLAIGGYIAKRVQNRKSSQYELTNCVALTPGVFELTFAPLKGNRMEYAPGQYVFVRFVKSALPKEAHPFSISGAPEDGEETVQIMVKNSGDYTAKISELKPGDIATLEGPYGNFLKEETANSNTPLVLLAGGIGITPILSILRSLNKTNSARKTVLVWGLAKEEDVLALEELRTMHEQNPDFSYRLLFSEEQVDGYDSGFMTGDYFDSIGIDALYPEADFFICGPAVMMTSVKEILKANQVAPDKIHLEEFSF